jgi:hypothetical protein
MPMGSRELPIMPALPGRTDIWSSSFAISRKDTTISSPIERVTPTLQIK